MELAFSAFKIFAGICRRAALVVAEVPVIVDLLNLQVHFRLENIPLAVDRLLGAIVAARTAAWAMLLFEI